MSDALAVATSIDGLAGALARLASDRDPEAWAAVLQRAGPHVCRVIGRISRDATLADDAVQETLLSIRDCAGSFRADKGGTDPDRAALRWMIGIAAHTAMNLHRRHSAKRECAIGEAGGLIDRGSASAQSERVDTATFLKRALTELPDAVGKPIALHYLGQLTLQEVADTLSIPLGTAKVRVHRGLKLLRSRLQRIGMALSLMGVAGLLGSLPAVTVPDPTGFAHLLTSQRQPVDPFPMTQEVVQGMAMATRLVLGALVVGVIGVIAVASARREPAVVETPAPVSPVSPPVVTTLVRPEPPSPPQPPQPPPPPAPVASPAPTAWSY
ncbi:MAG: sigma-70 family RNA polymerase sigma factor, partial [Planctomycetes bacterium]|nr:sigma-70 family RNA polymerase sigma factor [Planctomycetota bacterium]